MSALFVATMGRDDPSSPVVNLWSAVLSVAVSASVFCTTEFLPVGILRYIGDGLDVSEGDRRAYSHRARPACRLRGTHPDRRRQQSRSGYMLWALGALLIASNLVAMLAPNFWVLIVGRILFGVGLGGFWAIGAGLGSRLVAKRSAGQATAIIFAGVSIGMLIGGPAGALIGDVYGWRAAFGVSLILSIIALPAQIVFLPGLKVEQRVKAGDLLGILMTRKGRVGMAAMLLVLIGQFASYTYITPFLAQVTGFADKTISTMLLGYTAVGLIGNFIGGATAGRDAKKTFLGAIVFILLPLAILPVAGGSAITVVALLNIWGLAYGAMPVALQVWMANAAPTIREGGMALFVANFQISIALGSFIGGLVVDDFGVRSAMGFGAVAAALALACIVLF